MDDEDDGSAAEAPASADEDSSGCMGPWDSTLQPSDSDDASGTEVDESSDDVNEGEEPADEQESDGNVAGALAPDVPVEPGRPDPVNVIFVVLGAYLGVVAIASLLGTGGTFSLVEYVAVSVGFLALSGLVYGLLTRSNPDT